LLYLARPSPTSKTLAETFEIMRKHNRKIYYSAGLISIILLPILCILHLKSIDAFTDYRSIDLQIWDGKEDNIRPNGVAKYLNSKKYTIVNLNGNNSSDKTKLYKAKKLVHKLILSKDSINGLKFHFGEKSEYWTFISVLNILIEENAEFYVPYKSDIWFANPKPRKINKKTRYINIVHCGNGYNYISQSESINWSDIKELTKKYYLPIIAYFLMLVFTIKGIFKLNKTE
jgi:hypothetical protein